MTIYALSSGPGVSGVAVIRISGPETVKALKKLTNKEIPYAAERSKAKWGKYTIGSGVKIISEENARKLNPDYFFVMPYGFIN